MIDPRAASPSADACSADDAAGCAPGTFSPEMVQVVSAAVAVAAAVAEPVAREGRPVEDGAPARRARRVAGQERRLYLERHLVACDRDCVSSVLRASPYGRLLLRWATCRISGLMSRGLGCGYALCSQRVGG